MVIMDHSWRELEIYLVLVEKQDYYLGILSFGRRQIYLYTNTYTYKNIKHVIVHP